MKADEKWNVMYTQVCDFVKTHKKRPTEKTAPKLKSWLDRQKISHNKNELCDERIEKYIKLMDYINDCKSNIKLLNVHNEKFETRFLETVDFVRVNSRLPSSGEGVVGRWVNRMKIAHSDGTLPNWCIQRLEQIAGWEWSRSQHFKTQMKRLAEWMQRHKRMPHPRENQIGVLCSKLQRDRANGSVSPEQEVELEELPHWHWNPALASDTEDDFTKKKNIISEFVTDNHRLPTIGDDGHYTKPFTDLREKRENAMLTVEQEQEIEKIPGWRWRENMFTFRDDLEEIKEYVARNDSLPRLVDMANMVYVNACKKRILGILPQDQIDAFSKVPHWKWTDTFSQKPLIRSSTLDRK